MFCHRSPYAVGADGERNLIGRRTQSNRVANATRLDGERNPPLKINILTTDSVVSSLRILNFCGFRAFRERTIRTLSFCGFRAFRGRTIRTLNFCGFRAFRGRTIRTLNFCGFRAFRGRTIRTLNLEWFPCVLWALLFSTEFTKFTEPLAMGISYKKEATTKTAVASFYISTESEALLHANLLEQTLCVAPLIHEEEHVADIHTDAASQTLVEPDVA